MSCSGCTKTVFSIAISLSLLLLVGLPSQGQVLYGSIVGAVVDQGKSAVPDANVRVVSSGTSQVRETTTDASGLFSFPSLAGGVYEVTVTKPGFQTFAVRGLTVNADATVRVNAVLDVGRLEQTVEVSAQAATLQADSAEVRSEIGAKSLEAVPVPLGRNYQNLLVTVPGVMPPANQHSVAANPARGLTFSVNGTSRNSNDVRIDGALANNVWLPHVTAYVPSLDSIEAVSIVTASADAQQGLAGGSAVNVQIKSGTNDIHGSLFEFHSDNALKAKPFFQPVGQGKPKYINNQFGGSIGGPIKHNKLFYFASWEGTYERQTGTTFATVPTAAIRSGDMSGSSGLIYDPLTGNPDGSGRAPFANKQVPQARLDPIVQKLVAATPLPNISNLLSSNYYASGPYAVNRSKLDGKVNWIATDKLNVSGRMGWLHYTMNDPPVFGDNGGPPVSTAGGRAGRAFGDVYSTTYSAVYVVSPAFLVDSYFGWTQSNSNHDSVRLGTNIGLDVLGIPGTNGSNPLYSGWPDFQVSSYSDLGTPTGSSPLRYGDSQFEYVANGSWTKSGHNLRFGIDISHFSLNHFEAPSSAGVFTFNGGAAALRGQSTNQYNSYAQFLLGLASTTQTEALPFDNNQLTSRQVSYSLYAQDSWQATHKLTVALGVRWDFFPMGARASRGMERYNFDTNQMSICGVAQVPTDCGYKIEQRNFSPRLGIAYRPTSTFVIRAGYGINYDPYPLAFVRDMITNYPNDLLLTVNPANANQYASRLQDGIPRIAVPDISSGLIPVPVTYAVRSLPQNSVRGYIQSWNFSLQKQLPGGFLAQAAYVGSHQVHITQRFDLNAGQVLGAGTAGQPYSSKFGRTTATELLTPVGDNHYSSLQSTLQRRFSQGYQINLSYTLSKAIGICCDELSDAPPNIQIPQYFKLNRALMPFDRTHVFTATVVAELPFGRKKHWLSSGPLSVLAGGWQLNSLITAYSGSPFSVTASNASLNAPGNTQRANQVKPEVQILGGIGPNQPYFDPLAFAPVTTASFGNSGYDSLRGPGALNTDAGLFRNFQITERWRAEFRAEALNLTNTPHFANPSGTGVNVSNLQVANGSITNLGGFATINATTGTGREGIDERTFRFAVRFTF
jgi:outer membrane receptor protein involved in Fe transport